MGLIQAVILGIIQGLTEFIPISSSAHLIIIRWLLGWSTENPGLGVALDVALHLGTLLALLAYFWRDWYDMISGYLRITRLSAFRSHDVSVPATDSRAFLLWPVIFACIPAGIAGIAFEDLAANVFRMRPFLLAGALIGLGLLMLLADVTGRKTRSLNSVRFADWMIVGLAQALAIIPGVSRSGITITAGLFTGLEREAAAKFSFFLGTPIILGAALYEIPNLFKQQLSATDLASVAIGVLTSTVVGYLCIGYLLRYLEKRSTGVFVLYRVLLGSILLITYALGLLHV